MAHLLASATGPVVIVYLLLVVFEIAALWKLSTQVGRPRRGGFAIGSFFLSPIFVPMLPAKASVNTVHEPTSCRFRNRHH